jgi:chaperonin cofactor prefoldin
MKRLRKDKSGRWVKTSEEIENSEVAEGQMAVEQESRDKVKETMDHLLEAALQLSAENKHLLLTRATGGRAANCSLPVSETAISELKKLGFENYLLRSKGNVTLPFVYKSVGQFVSFVKSKVATTKLLKPVELLYLVINERTDLFNEYNVYLETSNQKPSSIK